jgi:sugar phosphate permease
LGTIAAFYFYAYAALQIPVGLTVDRFGPHRPLAVAIATAAVGSLAFSWAGSAGAAQYSRLLIGAGAAFSFIACLKLASNWFAPGLFATLAGLTNTAGMVGAALGGAPLAALVRTTGWRGAMGLLAGVAAALAVLVLLLVRDRPPGTEAIPDDQGMPPASGSLRRGAWAVVANRQGWLNAVYATAISIVFVAFGALWGTTYVEKVYGLGTVAASGTVSMLFFGAIAGSLFFGWFSDRIRRRRAPMIAAAVGGLLAMAAILYLPALPLVALKALLAALGFFCSANIISYAVAHDLCPPERAGLALGFLNTCYYAGSAISQPLVGWLLDTRAPRPGAGLAALTAADFRFALSAVVGCLALSLVAALLLEETHRHAAESPAAPADKK